MDGWRATLVEQSAKYCAMVHAGLEGESLDSPMGPCTIWCWFSTLVSSKRSNRRTQSNAMSMSREIDELDQI